MVMIQHACGHEADWTIDKTQADARQREIQWLESARCQECHHGLETRQSQAMARTLPQLHGSPRQVAWAQNIRAEKLGHLEHTRNWAGTYEDALATAEEIRLMVDEILAETDAVFWIRRKDRFMGISFVLKRLENRKRALNLLPSSAGS